MIEITPSARPDRAAHGSSIALDDVSIVLGGRPILGGVDLRIPAGEIVCLLGPSGCGKSTLLSAIAGFLQPATGKIVVDDLPVTKPRRTIGVVFQSAQALFPWLTARENVGYGPRMRKLPKERIAQIQDEYLGLVGLSRCAHQFPRQLSGGMRQRVQIARVLANEPEIVLMDEPFGALDAQTRSVMQAELVRIWEQTAPTIVFVTHDINEAILLGDRVITMTAGPQARIKNDYPVDLPRPRIQGGQDWLDLHTTLRQDIETEVAATMQQQGIS